jgi:molybdopterin-guanine dinucleotide biosynthesis protein A/rhodanese-related sulfurtransferase
VNTLTTGRAEVAGQQCAGAVLAGGQSRRMGRTKAALSWHGTPLAVHMANTLLAGGCQPVVQVGGTGTLGLSVVPDRYPGEGPLGGVLTALEASASSWLMVVACDLPRLRAATVKRLVKRAIAASESDVVVASTSRREPLCSVWRRHTALPVVEGCWDRGERSMRGVLGELRVLPIAIPAHDVWNVNTPAEFLQADNVGTMVEEITVAELSELMPSGVALIDVREPDEYVSGHAPGAVLVPLGSILSGEVDVEVDGTVYVICRSGARSMRACEFLDSRGLKAVNIAGGTMAWVASGFEVIEGMDPS